MSLVVASCSTPHNNVLVFGTDTNFGLGISAAPDPTAPASVTIGYKRKEAVWMPLVVNKVTCTDNTGDQSGQTCTTTTVTEPLTGTQPNDTVKPSAKYMGQTKTTDSKNNIVNEELDTYSVFASFGGKAKGGKDGGQLGMAQFFATGIAAQRLGKNPGAAQMVSTLSDNELALLEAQKRADANQKLLEDLKGFTGVSNEDMEAAWILMDQESARMESTLNLIFRKEEGFTTETTASWKKILASPSVKALPQTKQDALAKVTTRKELRDLMDREDENETRSALIKAIYGLE